MHALFVNIWILKDAVILNCEFETFQFPLRRKNLQCPPISSNIHLRHYMSWLSAFPGCIYTLLIFLISSLSLLSTFSIWPLSSLFSSYLRFSLSRYFLPSFSLPVFLLFLFPCIPDSTPFPLISNSPNSSFILLTFHPSFLHSLFFPFIPCILLANTPQHLFPPLTILSCSVWSHLGSYQHWCPCRRHEHCCPCLCPLLTLPRTHSAGNQRWNQWALWWQGNE